MGWKVGERGNVEKNIFIHDNHLRRRLAELEAHLADTDRHLDEKDRRIDELDQHVEDVDRRADEDFAAAEAERRAIFEEAERRRQEETEERHNRIWADLEERLAALPPFPRRAQHIPRDDIGSIFEPSITEPSFGGLDATHVEHASEEAESPVAPIPPPPAPAPAATMPVPAQGIVS